MQRCATSQWHTANSIPHLISTRFAICTCLYEKHYNIHSSARKDKEKAQLPRSHELNHARLPGCPIDRASGVFHLLLCSNPRNVYFHSFLIIFCYNHFLWIENSMFLGWSCVCAHLTLANSSRIFTSLGTPWIIGNHLVRVGNIGWMCEKATSPRSSLIAMRD